VEDPIGDRSDAAGSTQHAAGSTRGGARLMDDARNDVVDPVVPVVDPVVPVTDPERRRVERVMGTVVSLSLPDGGAGSGPADAAFAWLHEVDMRFSPFRPESEVSRLIRGELAASAVSVDLAEVLDLCETVEVLSDGAFDIRGHRKDGAPDPTGLVKGWAIERAAKLMAGAGIERGCLNAGGDVLAWGGRAVGEPWRIGIAHPERHDAVAVVLEASDLAVATSGTTERGRHIVDARTRLPADALLTTTVVGPSLARADGYATAAFAMGVAGLRWCRGLPGYEACALTRDGQLLTTAGFGRYRVEGEGGPLR
jgi:FAD:protein FMN transferase